jgi:hypothetical protein
LDEILRAAFIRPSAILAIALAISFNSSFVHSSIHHSFISPFIRSFPLSPANSSHSTSFFKPVHQLCRKPGISMLAMLKRFTPDLR